MLLFGYLNDLFFSLLVAILVNSLFFNFLRLDVITKFLVELFSKTVDNVLTIFLEASINRRISSRKSNITLTQNIIRSQDASNRQCTEHNCRTVQLNELRTSLNINDCEVLLTIFLRVLFFRDRLVLPHTVNLIDLVLGFFQNTIDLRRRLARHNSTGHNTDDTGNHKNFRAVLLKLQPNTIKFSSSSVH